MMYTVVYKSKAKENFTLNEIKRMLIKAKVDNRDNGISGCLLYNNKKFVQIFEGEKHSVKLLFDKIKADNRHYDIETLIERPTNNRLWSKWSMAFFEISQDTDTNDNTKLLINNHINSAKILDDDSNILDSFKEEASELMP